VIYHIVTRTDLLAGCPAGAGVYEPPSLAADGFIHCSLEASVIPVANDYYAAAEGPLLLLRIDPARITAETRYEAAAPVESAAATHLGSSPVFPHVYGPIDLAAVDGVGVLTRNQTGYVWPREFRPLDLARIEEL
jgi:uncharacterized protein (DUF952 family)